MSVASWRSAELAPCVEEDGLGRCGARVQVQGAVDDVERLRRAVHPVELELRQPGPRLGIRRLVEDRALEQYLGLLQIVLRDRDAGFGPQRANRRRIDRVRALGLVLGGGDLAPAKQVESLRG